MVPGGGAGGHDAASRRPRSRSSTPSAPAAWRPPSGCRTTPTPAPTGPPGRRPRPPGGRVSPATPGPCAPRSTGATTAPTTSSTPPTGSPSGPASTSAPTPQAPRCWSRPAPSAPSPSPWNRSRPSRPCAPSGSPRPPTSPTRRQKLGFLGTAKRRSQVAAVARREQELADGHADVRFSGYITVTADSPEALAEACGEVERRRPVPPRLSAATANRRSLLVHPADGSGSEMRTKPRHARHRVTTAIFRPPTRSSPRGLGE